MKPDSAEKTEAEKTEKEKKKGVVFVQFFVRIVTIVVAVCLLPIGCVVAIVTFLALVSILANNI